MPAAPFARPILKHLRKVVHAGCPDVEETLKWGHPHFDYEGNFCGMAAFKAHATFGFWKGALLGDGATPLGKSTERAMGQFGRITSLDDLPSERALIALVKRAAVLNDKGIKVPARAKPKVAKPVRIPVYFMSTLRENKKALAAFKEFSPSQKREYVEWLAEAKSEDTRSRRLATAVEWISEGKIRNWKYATSRGGHVLVFDPQALRLRIRSVRSSAAGAPARCIATRSSTRSRIASGGRFRALSSAARKVSSPSMLPLGSTASGRPSV